MIESDQPYDHHYDDDDDNKPMEYLHMENASRTLAEVSNLPVYRNFTLTAYLVNTDKEIHKSEDIIIETPEGGEYNMLWHYDMLMIRYQLFVTRHVTWPNIPQLERGNIRTMFPIFKTIHVLQKVFEK